MSDPTSNITSNVPEFSVGDLAFSLKKTLEDTYGRVRVRGELSRVSIAASGHMYSSLKDDNAVIDTICWKGVLSKLSIQPEEGLEVICTGRISTYPQRSNYQLIIESMELAGEGALLKMLEERKKKLRAEGLFNTGNKKQIPFLPSCIGVVTSPTGAVIRDILHRLKDRFPCHVILWPAKVQGKGAAEEITTGIKGLQTIDQQGLPKPDTIIVARGGGSLEDLMAFNEEIVVRATANCTIPLISAVGHETDTTLIDYASDLRAPTPTGAAEMAVPVRTSLIAQIMDDSNRLFNAINRNMEEASNKLALQTRGLANPAKALETKTQSLDMLTNKLNHAGSNIVTNHNNHLIKVSSHLKHPSDVINNKNQHLDRWGEQLKSAQTKLLDAPTTHLKHTSKMLEAYSFQNTLKRGFTLIRDTQGVPMTSYKQTKEGQTISIHFQDGQTNATISKRAAPKQKRKKSNQTDNRQESLF